MSDALDVILLDNFDSFSYNLADEFARRRARVTVFRNDVAAGRILERAIGTGTKTLLVISPGPGRPSEAGCSLEVIRAALGRVPLLGVCLGHQALIEAVGGTVVRAPLAVHGKASQATHDGTGPFEGLPSPTPVGRYHSLAAGALPAELVPIAAADDIVMAVSHRAAPALGVQFHPESVLTPAGGQMIDNLIRWASHVRS